MSDAYGSDAKPVILDPSQTIIEVGWPTLADIVIIRCGVDIPGGVGANLPCVFRRVQPAKRTTADPHQGHSLLNVEWVGQVTGATTFNPPNTGGKFWRNEPVEPGVGPEEGGAIELDTDSGVPGVKAFPLTIPNTPAEPTAPSGNGEWGAQEDGYNPGSYLYATGWANPPSESNNNCCLINIRKLRHDFEVIKPPPQKNQKLTSIAIAVAFNGVALSPGALTNLMVEFAAYRFLPGHIGSADFYTTTHGMVYANDVKMIARKVVKPNPILLRRVDFTYNLKKTITFSGGSEIAANGYDAFSNQPGG
jgi:hypothetical protein